MKTSNCSTCSAPIVWCETTHRKSMPVDAEPVAGGNLVLHESQDPREPPLVVVVKPGAGTHVSHFSTCPQADQHRKAP